MVNRGVTPPDFSTKIGMFRAAYPDLEYVDLDPVEAGYGDYTELSDIEVEGFLALGGDSVNRAIGYYYMQLSGAAAKLSKSTKDFDLATDLTKRAADLRATAQFYFDRADADDAADADYFDIVSMGNTCDVTPELTMPEWGRYYTGGRVC
jgi:hypothetical protein